MEDSIIISKRFDREIPCEGQGAYCYPWSVTGYL